MKTLLQIKPDDSEITSDWKKIDEQIETFFSETYKSKLADISLYDQEIGFNDFIRGQEVPKLSNEEQASLEGDLTLEEKVSYFRFRKIKLPQRIYETIFDLSKQDLRNLYNEAFQKDSLSVSQRRGVKMTTTCRN